MISTTNLLASPLLWSDECTFHRSFCSISDRSALKGAPGQGFGSHWPLPCCVTLVSSLTSLSFSSMTVMELDAL